MSSWAVQPSQSCAELLHHVGGDPVGGAVGAGQGEAGHLGPLHVGGEGGAQGLQVAGRGGEVLAAYDVGGGGGGGELGARCFIGSAPVHLALGDLRADLGGDQHAVVRVARDERLGQGGTVGGLAEFLLEGERGSRGWR